MASSSSKNEFLVDRVLNAQPITTNFKPGTSPIRHFLLPVEYSFGTFLQDVEVAIIANFLWWPKEYRVKNGEPAWLSERGWDYIPLARYGGLNANDISSAHQTSFVVRLFLDAGPG